jgi:hypothetical protein
MKGTTLLLICLLLIGCQQGRWVWQENLAATACPGGRVNQVKRTTDTHLGRVRQTVVNTDACLE